MKMESKHSKESKEITYKVVNLGDPDFDQYLLVVANLDRECMQREFCSASPWTLHTYREEIQQMRKCGAIIAEIEGKPIGAFFWGIERNKPEEIYLYMLAVKEEYRNAGIASRMALTAKKMFETSDEDCQNYMIALMVHEKNEVACEMYKKFGFYETDTVISLFLSGDGIEMKCRFKDLLR